MNQATNCQHGLRVTLRLLLVLHPAAFVLSCASLPELPWAPVARDASAGFYDSARLEYRLDAGKLGQPLDVVRVEGRRVAYEQIASSPALDQSTGTLVIQYPHPAGRAGVARVTFSLDSATSEPTSSKSSNPFKAAKPPAIGHLEEVHEVWAMDIPSAESDRYFQLLSTQNFHNAAAFESGPAQLAVTINGKQVRKSWEEVPQFNALAQRVRSEGQLVAYLRPGAMLGHATSPIASPRAYRELLARSVGPAAEAAGPPSASVVTRSPAASQAQTARLPSATR